MVIYTAPGDAESKKAFAGVIEQAGSDSNHRELSMFKERIKSDCLKMLHWGIRKISDQKPLRRPYYADKYNMTLRDWLIYHQNDIVFDQVKWMGIPALKNVLDAWIYQEILYEVQPDVLVEIGSRYGGSTKYFADIMSILGKGKVISIDIDRSVYELEHERVTALTGNSSDHEILSAVEEWCKNKTVMVIQDGDHRRHQVLKDLENYSKFVSINSYFIVEDGIVDLYHHGDSLGFDEKGPLAAIEEFLNDNPHFEIDCPRERYILTYNPKGFLKRIC
jgi:cephalosporin hydroxylase